MRVEENDFILSESEISGLAAHFETSVNRFSVVPDLESSASVDAAIALGLKELSVADESRLKYVINTLSSPARLVNLNYTIADESISRQVLAWPQPDNEGLVFLSGGGVEWRVGVRSNFQIQSLIQSVLAAGDNLRREPLKVPLSTVAVITLLATLDQLHYARLQSQLLHEAPVESVAIFELLARIEEATTDDFRWSLPFVEKGLPLEFISLFSEQNVIDGLQELIEKELLEAVDDGVPATLYVLTSQGEVIADAVLHDVSKLLLTFSDAMDGGETGHDVMLFVRGGFGLFLFMMSASDGLVTGLDGAQLESFLEEIFIAPAPEAAASLALSQAVVARPTRKEAKDGSTAIEPVKVQQEQSSKTGKRCEYCQHPLHDAAKFCDSCGKPVAVDTIEPTEPPAAVERFCPHCHQIIGQKAKFCGGCGKPVD